MRRPGVFGAGLALILGAAAPARADPVAETDQSTVGYPTAEAALAALKAKPGVVFSTQDGWTIADDEQANTVWSFPPDHDPAYPSVVKRVVTPTASGGFSVQTDVLCSASKTACDDLVRAFERMNQEMQAQMSRAAQQAAAPPAAAQPAAAQDGPATGAPAPAPPASAKPTPGH